MEISCPHCQEILTVLASQAGQVSECPKCAGKFHVPVPMAKPRSSGNGFGSVSYESNSDYKEFVNKKVAAGICGILLGGMGVHKFVLGLNNAGLIMLAVTFSGFVLTPCLIVPIFGPMIMGGIGLIEGILYLTKSDEEFYQAYGVEKKEWF